MQGNEIFAYIDAVANAKLEDINARLAEMLDVDNCTLSVKNSPKRCNYAVSCAVSRTWLGI